MGKKKIDVGQVWLVTATEFDDLIFKFEIAAAVPTARGPMFVAVKHVDRIDSDQVLIFDERGVAESTVGKWFLYGRSAAKPRYAGTMEPSEPLTAAANNG